MKLLTVKFTYLQVLLLLWLDRCDGLTDTSLPAIFYPFGSYEGDSVVTPGYGNYAGPINIPHTIFNNRALYVSQHV